MSANRGAIQRLNPTQIVFGSFTAEQWKLVCGSVSPVTSSFSKGSTTDNTPFDKSLGALENNEICVTCGEMASKDPGRDRSCEGHFSYVELQEPCYNVQYVPFVAKVLDSVCDNCGSLMIDSATKEQLLQKRPMERLAFINENKRLACLTCSDGEIRSASKFSVSKNIKDGIITQSYNDGTGGPSPKVAVSARRCLEIFRKITNPDMQYMGFNCSLEENPMYNIENTDKVYGIYHAHMIRPESWIVEVLPVIPTRSIPFITVPETRERRADDITGNYNSIADATTTLMRSATRQSQGVNISSGADYDVSSGFYSHSARRAHKKTGELTAYDIQKIVGEIQEKVDTIINNKKLPKARNNGIFPRIKGKGHYVDLNVLGKRSDYTGRAPIDAGVDYPINYLQIPQTMAQVLTVQVPVNEWNINSLQKMIEDGIVSDVINKKGSYIKIRDIKSSIYHLSTGDIVRRPLIKGDLVLFNRQPTLRKESIQAFYAVPTPGILNFRLALSVTPPFNADFDGDEMNLHLPQSYEAIAECYLLSNVSCQVKTQQGNNNTTACTQDSLLGSYILTVTYKNGGQTMIDWEEASSCFLFSQTKEKWGDFLKRVSIFYEDYVSINDKGKMKHNSEKKSIPGRMLYSLVFPVDFNYFVKSKTPNKPFSILIKNGVLHPDSDPLTKVHIGGGQRTVHDMIWSELGHSKSIETFTRIQFLTNKFLTQHGFSVSLDDCIPTQNVARTEALLKFYGEADEIIKNKKNYQDVDNYERELLVKAGGLMAVIEKESLPFARNGDKNAFIQMISAGAKGSGTNFVSIQACLGQQNIFSKRVPNRLTGETRSLSHFLPNEDSIVSRGFITSSFISGLHPRDIFFHSMAGREGLVATEQSVKETGYVQKQIGKKLEDVTSRWDGSARDHRNNVVQYVYGNDGLAAEYIYRTYSGKMFFVDIPSIVERLNNSSPLPDTEKIAIPMEIIDEVILSVIVVGLNNTTNPVSVSATERMRSFMRQELSAVRVKVDVIPRLGKEIMIMYYRSRAQDGEMVGLKATVSISEPTYQSSLNTHRTVGQYKAVEAVSGLVRLKELINCTKTESQKSPYIKIYFKNDKIDRNNNRIKDLSEINKAISPEDKKYAENLDIISNIRTSNIDILESSKSRFAMTHVRKFIADVDFLYFDEEEISLYDYSRTAFSFQKFVPPTWFGIYCALNGIRDRSIPMNYWCIKLKIDQEKLYRYGFTLSTLVKTIEFDKRTEDSVGLYCVPSPLHIGEIYVFIDYNSSHFMTKQTVSNEPFGIALYKYTRDKVTRFIGNSVIDGIDGISKVHIDSQKLPSGMEEWYLMTTAEKNTAGKIRETDAYLKILSRQDIVYEKTMTSDFRQIEKIFGLEAARKVILTELRGILGSGVDKRHIRLLVDSMTYQGKLTNVKSSGINRNISGPILKNTFEELDTNFTLSALYGEKDPMKSLTSSVIFASKMNAGTGKVDVVSAIEDFEEEKRFID